MVPEVPEGEYGANYLHREMRAAQEQDRHNRAAIRDRSYGQTDWEPLRRLVMSLRTAMNVNGLTIMWHGVELRSKDIDLNTALVAGSDQVALAAKIHGWCESHAWVEGPDRGWLADLIECGLDTGLYRRGMGWEGPGGYDTGPGVLPLLRARDDEPVVMSYSVTDQFPNAEVGDWMPPWPDGVPRKWDALTEEQQDEREQREESWCEIPGERQWEISLAGLRTERPWARLSADTLRTVTFAEPVTVYDLIAHDRDNRLRAILSGHADYREPSAVPSAS